MFGAGPWNRSQSMVSGLPSSWMSHTHAPHGVFRLVVPSTSVIGPRMFASITSRALMCASDWRFWCPSWNTMPVRLTASYTACASSSVRVRHFSQYTWIPSSAASMVMRECQWSGVAMITASTSPLCSRSL